MPIDQTVSSLLSQHGNFSILDELTLPSQGGDRVGLRFGLGIELYMAEPDRQLTRERVLKVVGDYQNRHPKKLNRFLANEATRLKGVTSDLTELVEADMAKVALEDGYSMMLLCEQPTFVKNDDVTPYGLGAFVQRMGERESSFVDAYFPVEGMLQDDDSILSPLIATLLRWCEYCRPTHGLAGLSVLLRFDSRYQTSVVAFPVLKRFPGIGLNDPSTFSFEAGTNIYKIKCADWLTILCAQLVDELGGINTMRNALEPECKIHRYSGGVVIQAGELPQIGDSNRQDIPQAYRKAAIYTRPVRFEGYEKSGLFKVPKDHDRREETLAWIRRFD